MRVDSQDWSVLTLEAFPSKHAVAETQRALFDRGQGSPRTDITLSTDGDGGAHVTVSAAEDGAFRAWVVRFNLNAGEQIKSCMVDGTAVPVGDLVVIAPGTGAVHGARFPTEIYTRGCPWFPRLLASSVTNGIPLGCPIFLPVHPVNCIQTLKASLSVPGCWLRGCTCCRCSG
jgi:hypothetical protein